jgi:aminoglycoside phosphotransferase (APT) family kinase protein
MLWDPASGLLTGVIDFEESRADDPALDFTPMLGEFGEEFYQAALSAYGGPADPYFEARVRFWSRAIVVHELGYGAGQGAQVHVENGLARLKKAIDGAPVIGGWVLVHTAAAREWRGMPGG